MTFRQQLAKQFRTDWADVPDLANVWVVTSQGQVDVDTNVTAVISQQTVAPNPAAPLASALMGLTVELVSPIRDLDDGLDELDTILPAFFTYVRTQMNTPRPTATAIAYTDNQSAYQIPITPTADIQE